MLKQTRRKENNCLKLNWQQQKIKKNYNVNNIYS